MGMSFAVESAPLLAIVTARLDLAGRLLEANAGFHRLLATGPIESGANVAAFFIQPAFASLAAAPVDAEGDCHRGLLTLGDSRGKTWTLRGHVRRAGGELRLVAEFDIDELSRLSESMIELNQELNAAQHALAQAHLLLRQQAAAVTEASLTDALTGAGNRRRLDLALPAEITRVRRTGDPLAAVMCDIDHFKRVNDSAGHAAGDKVLTRFGAMLRSQARPTDVVARYGGEEFVVLLPHTDLAGGVAVAERMRTILAAETIAPLVAPVTASFGVSALRPGDTADTLVDRADEALYRAKEAGRNRVATEAPGE